MPRHFPERLTASLKKKAQGRFLLFSTFNALSFALLAESVIVLFALKLGATDFHIGLLSSYVHLTMGFVLVGKLMVSRIGAARTYGSCWFARNIMAGLFILAPWVWVNVGHDLGLGVLMLASFIFFAFRSMGLSAENVLINDVTGPEDRGRFIGRWQFSFYVGMLGMLVAVSFWLGDDSSFADFQQVIATGCVMGLIASVIMYRIPESSSPRQSAREPMIRALGLLYREPRVRKMVLSWAAVISGLQLLVPFQVLAAKNGYLITDRVAVIFVTLQVLGMVAGSYMQSVLIDRSGPRPVMIINVLGLAVLSLLWGLSPEPLRWYYTAALFFAAGFCMVSLHIGLAHYLQSTVRRESLLNLSLLVLVVQGAAAGLVGTFIGGGLLEMLPSLGLAGLDVYRAYYLLVIAAQGLVLLVVLRLERLEERPVSDVLGMMFSVRDWRALISAQKLAETPPTDRAVELLDELGNLGSEVSERTLLEYLDSPLFTVRTAALEALDKIDFGSEAAFRLIEEVKDGEFSTAWMAAEILGKHRVTEAIGALRQGLYSNDFFLEGKCMLALAQLGDEPSYPRIIDIFSSTYNPRLVIHGARAIYHMGRPGNIPLLLSRIHPLGLPAEHDDILHAVFSLMGRGDRHFRLMTLYNRSQETGLDTLVEDTEARMRELGSGLAEEDRALLRRALGEAARRVVEEPEALIALVERALSGGGDKAEYLRVLVREDYRMLREASPRLRFALTTLAAFVVLEG